MPTRNRRTQMDDQKKEHIDPKWHPQRSHSKRLQTHYVPTYNVENTKGTNKVSLTSYRLFPEEQKGCYKGSRGTGELILHWSIDP